LCLQQYGRKYGSLHRGDVRLAPLKQSGCSRSHRCQGTCSQHRTHYTFIRSLLSNAVTYLQGSKFFYENGTQFFIKGIAYQKDPYGLGGESEGGTYSDPLADEASCKRDIPIMVEAGTNTIRAYSIDPKKDHDACMRMLQDAGIYVIADLSEPSQSINRASPQWTVDLFDRYKAVIDVLAKYDNTIGFFGGNEVTNNVSNTDASAFVKAAIRDSKKYIKDKDQRWLGVGYAANDDSAIRNLAAHYFNCGLEEEALDFWGYNLYSWCGENTMSGSGYDKQVDFFSNYSVPVFLAEYGCNVPDGAEGRLFEDTTALYSDDMSDVFSGGIAYMYYQEDNDYGLVQIKGGEAETMKNYDTLSSRVAKATPSSTSASDYKPTNAPAQCPGISSNWKVNSEGMPPTPDRDLCECKYNSLSCVPSSGLNTSDYGEVFGFICSEKPSLCDSINTNTTTGIYGAYSACNDTQKLAYVMNEYYLDQDSVASACDHDGKAEIRSPASAASSCETKLAQATATGSATASSGSKGEESFGLVSHSVQTVALFGHYAVGLYSIAAAGVGGIMLAL
jgi:hypothetical protein